MMLSPPLAEPADPWRDPRRAPHRVSEHPPAPPQPAAPAQLARVAAPSPAEAPPAARTASPLRGDPPAGALLSHECVGERDRGAVSARDARASSSVCEDTETRGLCPRACEAHAEMGCWSARLDGGLKHGRDVGTSARAGGCEAPVARAGHGEATVPEMRSARETEDVVEDGPEPSQGRNHAPVDTPLLHVIQDATVSEHGQDECELRPNVDSIDSPSACHETKAMRGDPLPSEEHARACCRSASTPDRELKPNEADVRPSKTGRVYEAPVTCAEPCAATIPEKRSVQETAVDIGETGSETREGLDQVSVEYPSEPIVQDTNVSESVEVGCELRANEDSMDLTSAVDETKSMRSQPHSHTKGGHAQRRSASLSEVTRGKQKNSPGEGLERSTSEKQSLVTEVLYYSSIRHGEQRDIDIPENQRIQKVSEKTVEEEPDTHHEGSDHDSWEVPSRSTMQDSDILEKSKCDSETPPKAESMPLVSPGDETEIAGSEPHSHAEGEKAYLGSDSQSNVSGNRQSRNPDECLEQSESEVGPSRTEASCHAPSEGDGVVDAEESRTSTTSEDPATDKDTPAMAVFLLDTVKTKIANSHSTPSFGSSTLNATSSHFDKIGGLARTLSDIPQRKLDSGRPKVIIPEKNGCEDIAQGTDPSSREQGSKDSLSKSRANSDIPETVSGRDTIPSGCSMQCGSGKELNNTSTSAVIHDDFTTDMSTVDPEQRNPSMDSSSPSLRQLEPPKPGLAHSTPALGSVDSVCSSSDLDKVENGESIKSNPHQIKRTYSSSVDTLVEEDIETLTTTSMEHTISSGSTSNVSRRADSSLLIGSNESALHQRQFAETLSDAFDFERDPLSASSLDADGAWREDHSFPRPHSRVKRMYSSSDSSLASAPDHEECIEISDSVTEALANSQWQAYMSECRRSSSAIEGRDLERLSKSGRLPHTGLTSSESMGSLPLQNGETTPLLSRNASQPVPRKEHSQGPPRRGMKSILAKKAARLLNFVLGKKNRSSNNNSGSQPKAKKKSLSSRLCGGSS